MPKQRSVHAGGYTVAGAARLQNMKLPEKVKCAICHKVKPVNYFSTIQQNALKNAIAVGDVYDATVEKWVPCIACTPKQVTELECCICGEVKGLDGFAKAQRRLGEEARCITCVAELNGETPIDKPYREHIIDELDKYDSDNDSEGTSNAYESSTFSGETSTDAGVPLSSASGYDLNSENLKSLNLSNDGHPKTSASQAATSASVTTTKRVRVNASPSDWQEYAKGNGGKSVESTSGARYTGYDKEGNTHQMFRLASTIASDDSENGTIPHPDEEARMAKEQRDAQSRFARIPGGRNVPVAVPTYYGGKTVPQSKPDHDDDEEDDDWGTI